MSSRVPVPSAFESLLDGKGRSLPMNPKILGKLVLPTPVIRQPVRMAVSSCYAAPTYVGPKCLIQFLYVSVHVQPSSYGRTLNGLVLRAISQYRLYRWPSQGPRRISRPLIQRSMPKSHDWTRAPYSTLPFSGNVLLFSGNVLLFAVVTQSARSYRSTAGAQARQNA